MSIILILPVLLLLVGGAIWVCRQAWLGNWRKVTIALGFPFLLAAVVAVMAETGALNSGQGDDWGPLMALLAAIALAVVAAVVAIIAGILGYFGKRSRAASITHTF